MSCTANHHRQDDTTTWTWEQPGSLGLREDQQMPTVSQSHAPLHAQEVVCRVSKQFGRDQDSDSAGLGSRYLFYQGLLDFGPISPPDGPKFS